MAKKQQMEHANAGRTHIEQTLWHGTSGAVVANINNKGFDRNYNSGNLRCRGVIRKFVEKCYLIALLLSIAMTIHRYKLTFIAS